MKTFAELGLSKHILVCLNGIGFSAPTEIQAKAIPPLLSGRDVMASAQTGSGKTGAYALPLVELLAKRSKRCRALILVPTRELALQVKAEFDRFSGRSHLRTTVLYGGTGYGKQINELRACPDVIVATPGRLFDFIQRGMADLSQVQALVLDEADRLLDMGFHPQVRAIVDYVPTKRLTAMFSATIDERIERLAGEFLDNPVRVAAVTNQVEPASIDQRFHKTNETEKEALLKQVIGDAGQGSVLVFTKTRRKATNVAAKLRAAEIQAHEIHGDISQNQREKTLDRYRNGKFSVLVATDVAARGLDIPAISHVVNYDLPQSPADYVHRIGRTGRAGRSGCAHTFVCDGDRGSLREIEKIVGRSLMSFPPSKKDLASGTASGKGRGSRRGKGTSRAGSNGENFRENSTRANSAESFFARKQAERVKFAEQRSEIGENRERVRYADGGTEKGTNRENSNRDGANRGNFGRNKFGKEKYGKNKFSSENFGGDFERENSGNPFGKRTSEGGKFAQGRDRNESFRSEGSENRSFGKSSSGKSSFGKASFGKPSFGKSSFGKVSGKPGASGSDRNRSDKFEFGSKESAHKGKPRTGRFAAVGADSSGFDKYGDNQHKRAPRHRSKRKY